MECERKNRYKIRKSCDISLDFVQLRSPKNASILPIFEANSDHWNCFGGSPVGYRQMNLSHIIRTRTACSAHSRMDIETFDWQQLCHIHKRDSTSSLKVKESWEVHGHTICYIIKSVSCNQILSEQNSSASCAVPMWHHRNG